jgi:8-oxo-dGTP diphosphatase
VSSDRLVRVVAGVLERDGRILICQRKRGDWGELKWEFPGGKVNPGESAPDALRRELQEELGIRIGPAVEIRRYGYQYPGKPPIELIFFRILQWEGDPANLEFEQIVWEQRPRLAAYDFLDGDRPFLAELADGDSPA